MIKYFESVYVIADSKNREVDAEDFAKEMGMKCDSVGWMRFDGDKGIDRLKQISEHAKRKGLKLRGSYEKTAVDTDAKWYRFFPRNQFSMSDRSYTQKYKDYWYDKIKAYKAPKGCNMMGEFVSQTFVDCYRDLQLTGLDFIWAPDNGKYRAMSFYKPIFLEKAKRCVFPGHMYHMRKETYDNITFAPIPDKYDFATVKKYYQQADSPEGRLCEVEQYMDNLDVALPLAVEYDSMPDTDFAYCVLQGFGPISLIRSEALQKMIHAGAVTEEDFAPVINTDAKGQDLLVQDCVVYKYMDTMLQCKEHFEKLRMESAVKVRPEFVPSEKDVLALLRRYKKQHPDYLNRTISKSLAERAWDSAYRPLLPYYKVGSSGRLAEYTYEYYDYETAIHENDVFHKELAGSNIQGQHGKLLEASVLFGRSLYGDNYLLLCGEQVYEVSCHDYAIANHWGNVYLFFYELVEG